MLDRLEFLAAEGSASAAAQLEQDPLPVEAEHIWTFFLELHAARQATGYGPQALSYTEIDAWMRLTGRALTPEELTLLRTVDEAYMAHEAEKARPADQPAPLPRDDEEDDEESDELDDDEDDDAVPPPA